MNTALLPGKKRAGQYIVRPCFPMTGNCYGALVLGGVAGATAFVFAGVVGAVLSELLQPLTTALIARPNSTTMDSFFIGKRNFYWFEQKHK
jgi:hypothetical protein